jgi:hypothetical protein
MKKLNSKGFSALEVILIIVVIALASGIGYYAYNSTRSTNTEPSSSDQQNDENVEQNSIDKLNSLYETKFGSILNSRKGRFSIAVPRGWTMTNDLEEDYALTLGLENMTYDLNKPAVVKDDLGFRGGGPMTAAFLINDYSADINVGLLPENSESFTTGAGLIGKKQVIVEDGAGEISGQPGTKYYTYQFQKADRILVASYVQAVNEPDQLQVVEDMLRTLKLNY